MKSLIIFAIIWGIGFIAATILFCKLIPRIIAELLNQVPMNTAPTDTSTPKEEDNIQEP